MAREWNNLKQTHSAGTQAMLANAALDEMESRAGFIPDDELVFTEVPTPTLWATGRRLGYYATIVANDAFVLDSNDSVEYHSTLRRTLAIRERLNGVTLIGFPSSIGQTISMELGRLRAGWAGEGTIAPGTKLILDIQNVAASFPAETSMPEIEVDPDDGSVILRWMSLDADCSLSLTFLGKREVTVFYSSPERSLNARKYLVTDAIGLSNRFNDDAVLALMAR
ncbi:hypothetical protein HJB88_03325 [Rhizobium sp. NZLR5]|uniref:hypothetical protein n=1 Tax=Rhizobium sp. NZLR5 TaxID=2731103 RepID=UPI001C8335B2|nr:hypothetical protein [Rhizobium sp. NZLR5]MBX5181678.1 hypothetical protein [Rhizobium sp. NZLR5]